ncbi:NUDIX hydrolase [Candidatus Leptofilum sp.]|uniref:NUDIX hydrolase n=1 Tax=Candidatus Leptofilum sp. TaxID=3241576 RepID=UPI003B5A5D4A
MSSIVKNFLQGKTAVATASPTWQWHNHPLPLRQQTYLCTTLPPDKLISSARAILLRGDEVMVIRDHQNEPYIIPGGRREPEETILETLHRELLEETGWLVRETAVIGTIHFQHLNPKPADYPYPHTHFFWSIFVAQAGQFYPEAIEEDFYVTSTHFLPIEEVLSWQLADGQHELLQIAVNFIDGKSSANFYT